MNQTSEERARALAQNLVDFLASYEEELMVLERETPIMSQLRRAVGIAIAEACYLITDQGMAPAGRASRPPWTIPRGASSVSFPGDTMARKPEALADPIDIAVGARDPAAAQGPGLAGAIAGGGPPASPSSRSSSGERGYQSRLGLDALAHRHYPAGPGLRDVRRGQPGQRGYLDEVAGLLAEPGALTPLRAYALLLPRGALRAALAEFVRSLRDL